MYLAWAILSYLQGRNAKASNLLKEAVRSEDGDQAAREVGERLKVVIEADSGHAGPALLSLVEALGQLLDPQADLGRRLARECPRGSQDDRALDSVETGLSRDPFRSIEPAHAPFVALAAAAYALRAHASFGCRSRIQRDFNAAKVALNDLFQSSQLAWRLYCSLPCCHRRKGNQDEYIRQVAKGAGPPTSPEESPYFVWSLIQLIEIQRGDVCRQKDNLQEAHSQYQRVQKRLARIERQSGGSFRDTNPDGPLARVREEFITPALIRSRSELSKVEFDLGHLAESLISALHCLLDLVQASPAEPATEESRLMLMLKVKSVLSALGAEAHQSVLDANLISEYFGFPQSFGGAIDGAGRISAESFRDRIGREHGDLAVDLLARIGFTLFTLYGGYVPPTCVRDPDEPLPQLRRRLLKEWLTPYLEAHSRLYSEGTAPAESRLGRYSLTMIGPRETVGGGSQELSSAWDVPEELLAWHLRAAIDSSAGVPYPLDDEQFFESLLAATTKNIHNIATIPRRNQRLLMRRGYLYRRGLGDLSRETFYQGVREALRHRPPNQQSAAGGRNKLVVLRRWQGVNPRIPRPEERRLRGGGYFLLWEGKGIVIDPGFDFIDNFYDEGFSLADIHAVVVTHSHPDHDDDISTLMTLVREWNEFHALAGESGSEHGKKHLDLFLNESAALKFSVWLKSADVRIGRVIPLPSLWWDKESEKPTDGRIRGAPVRIDLRDPDRPRDGYCMILEVVPAWHDDVIGRTAAVGLKFHLMRPPGEGPGTSSGPPSEGGIGSHDVGVERGRDPATGVEEEAIGVVGFTGDTGTYGHDVTGRERGGPKKIEAQYSRCDVLVAHLGDVRIRELMSVIKAIRDRAAVGAGSHPMNEVFDRWFGGPGGRGGPGRVHDFVGFLIALDLVPGKAWLTPLRLTYGPAKPLADWLAMLASAETWASADPAAGPTVERLQQALVGAVDDTLRSLGFEDNNAVSGAVKIRVLTLTTQATAGMSRDQRVADETVAWLLTGFLTAFSTLPWQYPFHLGTYGTKTLFRSMVQEATERGVDSRVFVVGELPEELTSYRHHVAQRLNSLDRNRVDGGEGGRQRVYALTGDIGLHIGLGTNRTTGRIEPTVRCHYCNYNNETVIRGENYHPPGKMHEVSVKRLNSAMIYLCRTHDHAPAGLADPRYYLSRPQIRVV